MLVHRLLSAPLFDLQAAAALLPKVDKKFIRNASDRELIPVQLVNGMRMYSVLNLIALEGLSAVADGGSSLTMAKFVGGILAQRAEDRARFKVLGTWQDMRWMVYRLDVTREQRAAASHSMKLKWAEPSDLGEAVQLLATDGSEVRVLPADQMIEGVVERYRAAGGELF